MNTPVTCPRCEKLREALETFVKHQSSKSSFEISLRIPVLKHLAMWNLKRTLDRAEKRRADQKP